MTESWVFLPPPSPSLPPRRRKGRGPSNRSDVPAEEEKKHEGEDCCRGERLQKKDVKSKKKIRPV